MVDKKSSSNRGRRGPSPAKARPASDPEVLAAAADLAAALGYRSASVPQTQIDADAQLACSKRAQEHWDKLVGERSNTELNDAYADELRRWNAEKQADR